MTDKQTIRDQLDALVRNAHQYACTLEIGDERTDAFELYEVLRRLQRRGAASQMLAATNPLLVDHNISAQAIQKFKQSEKFSVTNQQFRVEVTSYDTQTRQVDHSSIDLTAEQYKALARRKAPTEPVVLKFKTPPAESEELNRFYNLVFSPDAFFAGWVGHRGHYAYGKEDCVADDQDGFIYLFLKHNGQWEMTASPSFVNWNARLVEINI